MSFNKVVLAMDHAEVLESATIAIIGMEKRAKLY
jgi:hypothetical protein